VIEKLDLQGGMEIAAEAAERPIADLGGGSRRLHGLNWRPSDILHTSQVNDGGRRRQVSRAGKNDHGV
jgi:hypothetical protein